MQLRASFCDFAGNNRSPRGPLRARKKLRRGRRAQDEACAVAVQAQGQTRGAQTAAAARASAAGRVRSVRRDSSANGNVLR
jgi:hypothetical protein